jgi:hypothetical protein
MTKSRKRRVSDPTRQLGELAPYMRLILRVDDAEREGHVARALDLMGERPLGPDGKPFWRPWRVERLLQLATFHPVLPPWVTSRWLLEQALQDCQHQNRSRVQQALRVAIHARGGPHRLVGVDRHDAEGRVMDRDWLFRQCLLYDLGGLRHFLSAGASRALVAKADHIQEWARMPMGAYRLIVRRSAETVWADLATDELIMTPNIGSAALLMPGECVIGRMVPTADGRMFESLPLHAPDETALRVAKDPAGWVDVVTEAALAGEVEVGSQRFGLLSDAHPVAAASLLLSDSSEEGHRVPIGRRFLHEAAEALAHEPDDPEEIDVWACLGAAVGHPDTFTSVADSALPDDDELLMKLAERLADPAAEICRMLATSVRLAA